MKLRQKLRASKEHGKHVVFFTKVTKHDAQYNTTTTFNVPSLTVKRARERATSYETRPLTD